MVKMAGEYEKYFKEEQRLEVAIQLVDSKFLDVTCQVRSLRGDRLIVEFLGSEPVERLSTETDADVFLTTRTGWSICRCNAILTQKIVGRRIYLRLSGPVIEKQNREYYRLDVAIPLCYRVPEKQLLPAIQAEWAATREAMEEIPSPQLRPGPEGFRVVKWNGRGEIPPQRVNLSGGGLRFKTTENIEPGTLVAIDIFLPLVPPRVIHVVAEALRSHEILLGRGRGESFNTAFRFHLINEKDRETIIAFIFAEQRRVLSAYAGKR